MDLGLVAGLRAESFGEPGQRTFRLLVETEDGHVSLWLEKQQVVALLAAAEELLERVPKETGHQPTQVGTQGFVGELEVRVGSLSLGFDAQHVGFVVEAGDFDTAFDLTRISLLANRSQLEEVRDALQKIVGESRPRCPLCGTPLTGEAHFCPQSNGHAHLSLDE